jgi:hypothetical protein
MQLFKCEKLKLLIYEKCFIFLNSGKMSGNLHRICNVCKFLSENPFNKYDSREFVHITCETLLKSEKYTHVKENLFDICELEPGWLGKGDDSDAISDKLLYNAIQLLFQCYMLDRIPNSIVVTAEITIKFKFEDFTIMVFDWSVYDIINHSNGKITRVGSWEPVFEKIN